MLQSIDHVGCEAAVDLHTRDGNAHGGEPSMNSIGPGRVFTHDLRYLPPLTTRSLRPVAQTALVGISLRQQDIALALRVAGIGGARDLEAVDVIRNAEPTSLVGVQRNAARRVVHDQRCAAVVWSRAEIRK